MFVIRLRHRGFESICHYTEIDSKYIKRSPERLKHIASSWYCSSDWSQVFQAPLTNPRHSATFSCLNESMMDLIEKMIKGPKMKKKLYIDPLPISIYFQVGAMSYPE